MEVWKCSKFSCFKFSRFQVDKFAHGAKICEVWKSEKNIGQITNSQQRFQRGVLIGSESVKVCKCEFPIALIVEYLLTVPYITPVVPFPSWLQTISSIDSCTTTIIIAIHNFYIHLLYCFFCYKLLFISSWKQSDKHDVINSTRNNAQQRKAVRLHLGIRSQCQIRMVEITWLSTT